jgi:uncharacterized Zn finger protein (UPF0148 family)
MAVAGRNDETELIEPTDICAKCGSKLLTEDGKLVCPHCDGDIDYFGEDEDE